MCGFLVKAQDMAGVTFEMKFSKPKLGLNERLRVDFTMNKDWDNFKPPDFAGFKVLMGPSQSISSSWVNGVRSYSKSYSYTLAPKAMGKWGFNQPITASVGLTYKRLPEDIEFTAPEHNLADRMTEADMPVDTLHSELKVPKINPYINEPIP